MDQKTEIYILLTSTGSGPGIFFHTLYKIKFANNPRGLLAYFKPIKKKNQCNLVLFYYFTFLSAPTKIHFLKYTLFESTFMVEDDTYGSLSLLCRFKE